LGGGGASARGGFAGGVEAVGGEAAEVQLAEEAEESIGEAGAAGHGREVALRGGGGAAREETLDGDGQAGSGVGRRELRGELVRHEESHVDLRHAAQREGAAQVGAQERVPDEHGDRREGVAALAGAEDALGERRLEALEEPLTSSGNDMRPEYRTAARQVLSPLR